MGAATALRDAQDFLRGHEETVVDPEASRVDASTSAPRYDRATRWEAPVKTWMTWKKVLWQQFGAAIDTLGNTIRACPEALWDDGAAPPELFWYGAYHCIFYLDCYMSPSEEGFAPPPPYGLSEFDPEGAMPERTYTKEELLAYLGHGRRKCRARIESLTEEDVGRRCGFAMRDLTAVELLLYVMRHVQHHAAQLNLLLRQRTGSATPWVSKAKESLAS